MQWHSLGYLIWEDCDSIQSACTYETWYLNTFSRACRYSTIKHSQVFIYLEALEIRNWKYDDGLVARTIPEHCLERPPFQKMEFGGYIVTSSEFPFIQKGKSLCSFPNLESVRNGLVYLSDTFEDETWIWLIRFWSNQ